MRLFHKLISWILVLVLAAAVLPASAEQSPESAVPSPAPGSELLRLHQIDIGCGDAYLLTVGDYTVLVDCGTDSTLPIAQHVHNYPLFDYLEAVGIDHVDLYFVTHWHNDHCYNVDTLMELYGREDTVVYGSTPELYAELAPLPTGIYRHLIDGDHFTAGPLDILCVGPVFRDNLVGTFNHDSLNFIVTWGNHRFLFTGDFVERTVCKNWPEETADIDVLSFPHHGLEPMTMTKECFRHMDPRLVLIPGRQAGPVRSFAFHTAYAGKDAVYLSMKDGNLLVTSDGTNLWYAANVVPGELPLGELLPPRTED